MSKGTKKVGITGKYGVRYGRSLRTAMKKFENSTRQAYICGFCGKTKTRRTMVGIWQCRGCYKKVAGGAYAVSTPAAVTAAATVNRLKKNLEMAE